MKTFWNYFFLLAFLSYYVPLHGQSIPEIANTLEIDTLLKGGAKDNRINFAFANVNDPDNNAYTSKTALQNDIAFVLRHFDPNDPLAKLGFSQYRDFFNIYSVWFPEPLIFEPKPSYYQTTQGLRDYLFLPWANDQHGWISMFYTLEGGGGGGAGVVRERRVGDALIYGLDWETVLHEFNHTMPGVLDEYTASGIWSNYECLEGPNTTGGLSLDDIPWRKWIDPETPIPTPYTQEYFESTGVFEGTISGYFGCHRPTARGCYMGAGGFGEGYGEDMCVVCTQRFICMMYQYVNVIEEASPSSSNLEIDGPETISFSANMVKPIPNTQRYEWFLNGKLIAKNVESVDVAFSSCDQYELTLVVTDTTDQVRFDEKFADRYPEPKQSRTWFINQTQVDNYDLSNDISSQDSDCTGLATGSITLNPSGGAAPYSFYLNGQETTDKIEQLSAGIYEVDLVDANGCGFSKSVEIQQQSLLDYELVIKQKGEDWTIQPLFHSAEIEGLSYQWSTGENTSEIQVSNPGSYQLKIRTPEGCEISKSIDFAIPATPLNIQHTLTQASTNADNGAIYLDLAGGQAPYSIQWFRGESKDQTQNMPSQVIASGGNNYIGQHPPGFAFDDRVDYSTDFWAEGFSGNNYIGYDFGVPTEVSTYSITSNVDVQERDAKAWKLQGSNNGSNWTTIQSVNDYNFPFRLQKDIFYLDQPATYRYFRLLITANQGDSWLAIQEVEFGTSIFEEITLSRDDPALVDLGSGIYQYIVEDAGQQIQSAQLRIEDQEVPDLAPIQVVQEDNAHVKIDNPDPRATYFWFADKATTQLLHKGQRFQPLAPGNYYVKALLQEEQAFGSEVRGFAIRMMEAPTLRADSLGLHVEQANPNIDYVWYNQAVGGTLLFIGPSFMPSEPGEYYASARMDLEAITPIDPLSLPGIKLWMDASDLNGDGVTDASLPNSSAYQWKFREGGQWEQNNWFPYRGNYQNGLGVVDFATLWFQYLSGGTDQFQTILMAYEENDLSFPESAPIYGLKENIPRHSDASQLFSNAAPRKTLNGRTYLNGEQVNPLSTPNPLEFMLLSVVMTEQANNFTWATHEYWEGKIGEIILFENALSADQIQGVNEFLRKKWLSTAELESPRIPIEWQNLTTSVDDLRAPEFKVFPNPSKGITYVQTDGSPKWELQLSDLSGKILLRQQVQKNLTSLNLDSFKSGIYIITLFDQKTGYLTYQKLVKTQ